MLAWRMQGYMSAFDRKVALAIQRELGDELLLKTGKGPELVPNRMPQTQGPGILRRRAYGEVASCMPFV
jgi:hypothetical protein